MKMKPCLVFILLFAGAELGAIEKRILEGVKCGNARQYHVEIVSEQKKTRCGGSLLNTLWIITAAHCGDQRLEVKIGGHNGILSRSEKRKIETNQQFFLNDEKGLHDIMLIKLPKAVNAKHSTLARPPGQCNKPGEHERVQVGGYGGSGKKAKLRCATTTISPCGENDKPDSKYYSDKNTTMCAHEPGVQSCYGDAGSAVEYNNALSGIIVSDPVDICTNLIVMLNICHYREWIENTMREN